LRAPFGRPLGLPLWPGSNGRPRAFFVCIATSEISRNPHHVLPNIGTFAEHRTENQLLGI
jgi:hypothetical protein